MGGKGEDKNKNKKARIVEFISFAILAFSLVTAFIKGTFFEPERKFLKNIEQAKVEVTYGPEEQMPQYFDEDIIGDLIDEFYLEDIKPEDELSQMVANGVSFNFKPQTLTNVYDLYEEDLPSTIEEDEEDYVPHEHIKINVPKKPPYFGDKPVIAIVIDDMGVSPKRTKDINSLHAPITSSFLTYARNLKSQIEDSRRAGHFIIVHVPMEAKVKADVAPDVLTTAMSKEEVQSNLEKMLQPFNGIEGINNHMGSKFTESAESLSYVMEILKKRGMFFLDSKTSPDSKVKETAQKYDVEYVSRNVFLDNNNNYEYIMGQLKQTERVAEKNGFAIAIGHPKNQTYLALKDWIPTVEEKGFKLVKLSEIVDVLNPHYMQKKTAEE